MPDAEPLLKKKKQKKEKKNKEKKEKHEKKEKKWRPPSEDYGTGSDGEDDDVRATVGPQSFQLQIATLSF